MSRPTARLETEHLTTMMHRPHFLLLTTSVFLGASALAQAPGNAPKVPPVRQTAPTIPVPSPVAPSAPKSPPPSAIEGSPAAHAFAALALTMQRRAGVDATVREQIAAVRSALEAELSADSLSPEARGKLLALSAQCAAWSNDEVAMDAAYSALLDLYPANQTIRVRWAQQCTAAARWQKAVDLLYGKTWEPSLGVDAHYCLAEGLMGIAKFNDAQGALNTAPPSPTRTGVQQSRINALSARIQTLYAEYTKEMLAQQRDLSLNDLPVVEILTTKGPITIKLFEREAPNTVAHFIEHIDLGTYNGTRFHRPQRGWGVQGGDPLSKEGADTSTALVGTGSGGWLTVDECTRADRRGHFTGSIGLAKRAGEQNGAAPLTCGSQFYIAFGPAEYLNDGFTVFGSVVDGLDNARMLTAEDSILQVNVMGRNPHPYTATRLPDTQSLPYEHPYAWGMKSGAQTSAKPNSTGTLAPVAPGAPKIP